MYGICMGYPSLLTPPLPHPTLPHLHQSPTFLLSMTDHLRAPVPSASSAVQALLSHSGFPSEGRAQSPISRVNSPIDMDGLSWPSKFFTLGQNCIPIPKSFCVCGSFPLGCSNFLRPFRANGNLFIAKPNLVLRFAIPL